MARSLIPILEVGGNLLTTINVDLHDKVADALQADLLTAIEKTSAAGLIIDISGLDEVDTYVARTLADTARMVRLMGTRSVVVGMRAEVAVTLVRMGYTMEGIETALDVDHGLALLGAKAPRPPAAA
jgi:rsbT antagonist protein RsbS